MAIQTSELPQQNNCSWCGAEIEGKVFLDIRGDQFCSRDQSSSAVKRLRDRTEKNS